MAVNVVAEDRQPPRPSPCQVSYNITEGWMQGENATIDGGGGTIGAALDTGWFATQGYDPVDAVRKLGQYIFHVHLNEVVETGTHHTCRYGAGIVPVEGCVRALQKIGYEGVITSEHEPEQFDPTEDIRASFAMLREWLS